MQNFEKLFQKLGLSLSDEKLLSEAFTHRSAVNEKSGMERHNERMEFLGDAVLELITTEFLYEKFPEAPEGELTNLRSALVKGDHLAEVARRLNLGEFLILSHGERKSGGAEKDYLLANVVESLIGAIYLEKGMKDTTTFIHTFILCDLEAIIADKAHIDAKSEFQELTQGTLGVTPHYEVVSEEGLDHEKTFVLAAFLGDKKVGEGNGGSKKEAQVNAAADALSHKKDWLPES